MIFALSQSSGFMIVGLVTAACTFVSGYLAVRASRQSKEADLSQGWVRLAMETQRGINDDLRTARDELKAEVVDLKTGQTDTMARLLECETARVDLMARLAVLEP